MWLIADKESYFWTFFGTPINKLFGDIGALLHLLVKHIPQFIDRPSVEKEQLNCWSELDTQCAQVKQHQTCTNGGLLNDKT
eukprot:UN02357